MRFHHYRGAVALAVLGLTVLSPAAVHAATVTDTMGGLRFVADDTDVAAGAMITNYTGAAGADLNIPHEVVLRGTTYRVTGIADGVFKHASLTQLFLPPSITSIGAEAFADNNLTSITLPATVASLGEAAFDNNPGLSQVFMLGNAPTLPALGCVFGAPGGAQPTVFHRAAATGFDAAWNSCGYPLSTAAHTVTYDATRHGGEPMSAQGVVSGSPVARPADPYSPTGSFVEWQIMDASGAMVAYDFSAPVTSDITLVATYSGSASIIIKGSIGVGIGAGIGGGGAPTTPPVTPRPTTPVTPRPTAPTTPTTPQPATPRPVTPQPAAPVTPRPAASSQQGSMQQHSASSGRQLAHTGIGSSPLLLMVSALGVVLIGGVALVVARRRRTTAE